MYSLGVAAGQRSVLSGTRPTVKTESQTSFATELAAALKPGLSKKVEQTANTETPFRQISAVDAAVQKDIQEAFGIEPHKPGDNLKSALDGMWPFKSSKPGSILIEDMESNAETASGIFQKHLEKFIRNENVSTKPPIQLTTSGDGSVKVQDGHPDKEKIENFINGNPELRNLYAGICSTRDFVAIAKESIEFQKRYAVDPQAAIAEFSHLFSGKYSYNTSLVISENSWDYQTKGTLSLQS